MEMIELLLLLSVVQHLIEKHRLMVCFKYFSDCEVWGLILSCKCFDGFPFPENVGFKTENFVLLKYFKFNKNGDSLILMLE